MFIGNRYKLHEELGKGGMGAVYRATDRLTGQIVALKRVLLSPLNFSETDTASTKLRVSLAREFQTLASLRHPHIINVLDYGFDQGQQPYFTMPLLEKAEAITDAAASLSLEGKIDVLIQLLQALAYLHRRGILHRDLKPGNVLVENKELVRVLDFGLAMAHEQQIEETAGTLAYIAPEVINSGKLTAATDLFAVGIMAYEIFTGQYPFDTSSVPALVKGILYDMPDLSLITNPTAPSSPHRTEAHIDTTMMGNTLQEAVKDENLEQTLIKLPGAATSDNYDLEDIDTKKIRTQQVRQILGKPGRSDLTGIIERLLAKDAQARYQDAYDVIHDLSEFIGRPVIEESEAIRESFLQAATFVGRDRELNQLKDALAAATKGSGSIWLVGGESGVGKSRLLDELRIQALVQGAIVVRGQSVEDGGLPYHLWREPLRRLALSAELTDIEAGILKEIVPDIGILLERDIPEPPLLEGKAKQQRLMLTILDILRKQPQPTVLLLEDLHWAKMSLIPLQQLIQVAEQLSVLIVGNYSVDENPNLPDELPGSRFLKLERLSSADVAALCVSMLGEAGKQPELLDFLRRETEGNVFFMVETVRALAEEAGQLSAVGAMQLPAQVFAGGIRQIILRRLERVPQEYHPLLKLAAVAGRRLDLAVLSTAMPDADFDNLLLIGSNVAVFDQQDGHWRFSHDKLRETLIATTSQLERRFLHRKIAEAIERVYPNDPAQARILMEHWYHVGHIEKERSYARIAGEQALSISNLRGARELFERALALAAPEETAFRAMLSVKLGKANANLSDYTAATDHLNTGLTLAREIDDLEVVAEALNELAWVAEQQGRYDDGKRRATEALEIARSSGHEVGIALALKNLGNTYRLQGNYEEAQRYYEESLALRMKLNDQQGMAVVLNNLGITAHIRGDTRAAHDYFAQATDIHKRIGARFEIAAGLDNLGIISVFLGDPELGKRYLEESLAIRRDIGDRSGIASTLNNLGMIAKMQSLYRDAARYLEESLILRKEIGDRAGAASSLSNLGAVAAAQGRTKAARDYFRNALAEAKALGALPLILEAVAELAGLQAKMGDYMSAARWLSAIIHHPALDPNVQEIVDRILPEVRDKLPSGQADIILNQGKTIELDHIVDKILEG